MRVHIVMKELTRQLKLGLHQDHRENIEGYHEFMKDHAFDTASMNATVREIFECLHEVEQGSCILQLLNQFVELMKAMSLGTWDGEVQPQLHEA